MSINPIQIEELFGNISTEIKRAGSERVQLFLIYRFLKAIEEDYQSYDSYVIQLFEWFPSIDHPLLFTGLRPSHLELIIKECEYAVNAITELQKDSELLQKIDRLHSGLQLIYSWLGVKQSKTETSLDFIPESESVNQHSQKTDKSEVFIPVIEPVQDQIVIGRLRKLKINVIGKSTSESQELKPIFGVIGADAGNMGQKAANAADYLLNESINKHSNWSATASFKMSHTWHAGNSANLALSGLFYCELLKAENRREYFEINPGIAITGDIDETGRVLEVDEETLKYKVEAAFISWVQALVVPVHQLDEALSILESLQAEYPNRNLLVKGIGELRELLYDRRLSLHKQNSLVAHTAKKVWDKRYSTAVVVFIIILLGVIGRTVYGPIDRNPVSLEFEGTSMLVKNAAGKLLLTKEVGNFMVLGARSELDSRYRYSNLIDVNNDGINEIFWVSQKEMNKTLQRSELIAGNVYGDTLWRRTFDQDLNFEFHPYINTDVFFIRYLYAEDLDNDGSEELIVTTTHEQYFPSYLYVLDPKNGKIKKSLLHHGFIERVLFKDMNEDDKKEIIYAGTNNTNKLAFLAAVTYDELEGQSGDSNRYSLENEPATKEIAYILFPQSIVGKTLWGGNDLKTNVNELFEGGKQDVFMLRVIEFIKRNNADVAGFVTIQYTFNDSLELINIAPGDDYDLRAQQLYREGKLDLIADGKYLQQLKDSLHWWNGETFQHKPTRNREYLRAVDKLEE